MRKVLIVLLILLILLLGGGGAGYFFFGKQIRAKVYAMLGKPVPAESTGPAKPPAPVVPNPTSYYKLPQIMGTVIGADYSRHILQATVAIYLHEPTDLIWVQAYLPRITDAFQTYIRDDMIVDRDHPIDIAKLCRDMLPRINAVIAPARIDSVEVLSLVVE